MILNKLTTLAALIIVLGLAGTSCSSDKSHKIGYLVPNYAEDRYAQEKEFFSKKVAELGGEALVVSGENNDGMQIQQASELIAKGADVLVVNCINKNTAAEIVRYAHSKGVKVIAYERIISNCELDYYISFDNVKVGELMADYAVKKQPEGTYYLLCGDKSDQNALWVKEGYMKVLNPHLNSQKIKIVYSTFVESWSGENAENEIDKYLRLSGSAPDVILSAYDGLSTGAIKALEKNKFTTYPIITGQNAELEACRNIVKGKQSMTVYKALKLEAETAAEMAIKIANGEKIKLDKSVSNGSHEVPSLLLDPVSVDVNNLKEVIIKGNHLKEADVYN